MLHLSHAEHTQRHTHAHRHTTQTHSTHRLMDSEEGLRGKTKGTVKQGKEAQGEATG